MSMVSTRHSDAYTWFEPTVESLPLSIAIGGVVQPVMDREHAEMFRGAPLHPLEAGSTRTNRRRE